MCIVTLDTGRPATKRSSICSVSALTAFKNGSVVSWQPMNLQGEYDFSEEKRRDSVGLNLPKILSFKQEENREG